MTQPVNYIVEADIKGFFEHVDHKWMMECQRQRISDRSFLRLIGRFLRAGIMEEGKYIETEEGILSPVLSNIYLHYVVDLFSSLKELLMQAFNGPLSTIQAQISVLTAIGSSASPSTLSETWTLPKSNPFLPTSANGMALPGNADAMRAPALQTTGTCSSLSSRKIKRLLCC